MAAATKVCRTRLRLISICRYSLNLVSHALNIISDHADSLAATFVLIDAGYTHAWEEENNRALFLQQLAQLNGLSQARTEHLFDVDNVRYSFNRLMMLPIPSPAFR